MTGPGGKDGESYIFFVGRENYPVYWVEGATYLWGKAQVLQEGNDVVLIGTGPSVGQKPLKPARKLAEQGIKATVINNPFIIRWTSTPSAARSKLVRPPGHDRGSSGRLRHGRPDLACPLRSGHSRIVSKRWASAVSSASRPTSAEHLYENIMA